MPDKKDLQKRPIGVLDSGVGGLSVLKALVKELPNEDFLYLGDTARTPYGTRAEEEIRKFVEEMLCYLEEQKVKQAVLACNTITALGCDRLQKAHPFGLVGMSKGEQQLLAVSKKKKIGIMATPFTVASAMHKKALEAIDPAVQVYPVPCPKFVPLVEGERFAGPELASAVDEYTRPLKEAGVDAVCLSCTHYPFLQKEVQAALGSAVTVIDPAEATAVLCRQQLEREGLLNEGEAKGSVTVCCTADIERVRRLAARMLSERECDFRMVTLPSK